ncbi:MAG: DUF4382 domain-containing protein [Terracidiphilus sp.]
MSPQSRKEILRLTLLPLAAAALLIAGCSSTTTATTQQSNTPTGPAFLIGTDAPMASVVSFQATVESVTLTNSSGSTTSLITGTPTVDFARFNGLQGLVDMTDVPQGTYTGVTITLGSATIGYLDTTKTPPAISTMPVTYSPTSSSTVSVTLNKSLVVANGGAPVGLRIDFDLAKSIAVDSNGNITGDVDPTFDVRTVARTDTGAHIDELIGAVVTVPSTTTEPSSFVIQGPHGEQFTVDTSSTTDWDGDASLSTLTTNSIVQVAGQLDPADQTLDADEVAVLSDSGFYAGGLVTYVTPSSGAASSFDFYVRSVLPDSTGVQLGDIAQVNLTGSEKYFIYWMRNPMTQFLFNSAALTPGQEIGVGGKDSGAASASAVTVNRIHLRDWGYNGTVVKGSQNSGQGLFQMKVTGFAGQVVSSNVTVYLGPACDFRYGFGAFGDLTDGTNVRVVGLLLNLNGNLVMVARHVDSNNFTDTTTSAWQ